MKTAIAAFILFGSFPLNAYENIANYTTRHAYHSQKGYAFENKCFRYEYREYYVPGNSKSPGHVKSYNQKVSVPCKKNSRFSNHYHYEIKPETSYTNFKSIPKCTTNTTLGGLIGGGIAASLSEQDAYGWTIPLGAVLGAGIANAECK